MPVAPSNSNIIGREQEKQLLSEALASSEAELIAIYGRRRVGKTFLVREHLRDHISFELSGLHGESMARQLESFTYSLRTYLPDSLVTTPVSWLEAFEQIKTLVEIKTNKSNTKQVLFFDEFPWLATKRSGFLAAFENFWNTFASRRKDIVVVICGSAASWMIDKVIGSKGGLHNRTTRRIRLSPFFLFEVREYLEYRHIKLDDYQIAQLYMAIGGVPHYLNHIKPGQSVAQNLDRLCFSKDGILHDEFQHLYAALFENHTIHEAIVRALAKAPKGLTRDEILISAKLRSGGGVTSALQELIQSGFIMECHPRENKVKDTLFRLSDEYSLFYFNWIESNRTSGNDIWLRKATSRNYATWCGYAFESLCLKHITQIKAAIGIANVETSESSWMYKPKTPNEEGAQVDLLIDRRDHCTNVCEIKFSQNPFVIDKAYSTELDRKLRVLQEHTKTRSTLFLTMITTYGIKQNEHAKRLVSTEVTLKDLMKKYGKL